MYFSLSLPNGSSEQKTMQELLQQAPYTLLYFYPKDSTPGCTIESRDFTKLVNKFNDLDIQIIWVSRDDHESHCSFIQQEGLQTSLISDPELTLHKLYGARGEKNNYGKIVTGVIRSTVMLDKEGKIIHQWNNVKATGHASRILKKIQNP